MVTQALTARDCDHHHLEYCAAQVDDVCDGAAGTDAAIQCLSNRVRAASIQRRGKYTKASKARSGGSRLGREDSCFFEPWGECKAELHSYKNVFVR